MSNKSTAIIVTGSSGYVGTSLVPYLRKFYNVITLDLLMHPNTDHCMDIANPDISTILTSDYEYIIIHLAAARFDFGISASKYFKLNVESTKSFLDLLANFKVSHFIHYSSVAAIDGENIVFSDNLSCDDAYRSSKYLQSKIVQEFCCVHNIPLTSLLPSAIYSNDSNINTNIAKLQKLTSILPFIPYINVMKSLTSLSDLTMFTNHVITNKLYGPFITIDDPIQNVTCTIERFSKKKMFTIYIPFLFYILFIISFILTKLFRLSYLTPNRVVKLFTDTSYIQYHEQYNFKAYSDFLKTK